MEIVCGWCKKSFVSTKNLKIHTDTAKYCLKLRGESLEELFECNYCFSKFINELSVIKHHKYCLGKAATKSIIDYKNKIDEGSRVINNFKNEITELETKIEGLTEQLHKKDKKIMSLKTRYELTFSHSSKGTNINFQTNHPTKRKSKTTIPPKSKETIWKIYIGNTISATCPVCNVTPISCFSFDCGHVIAESNGGTLELENLRPICGSCNSSMGTKNMKEYTKEFYPKSPILLTF